MTQHKATPLFCLSFSLSLCLCLLWRGLWFKTVCNKLFIHMVTELQTYVLPTSSIPLYLPSPPLLSLSRSLFTRFWGFQTSAFPKIRHSCTPTFSHSMARLFQILPHKLAHSLPSVSEQNIAHFSFALDVYQLMSLFLQLIIFFTRQFCLWKKPAKNSWGSQERDTVLLIHVWLNILNILMSGCLRLMNVILAKRSTP